MQLILSVIGAEAEALGDGASVAWTDGGGTIGRAANNDWTLPDPGQEISRCHARVRFASGGFYLEDTSANGVFLNNRATRLSAAEAHRLRDGERLFIGGYQILVRIDAQAARPAAASPPASWQAAGERAPDPLELLGGPVRSESESPPLPSGTGSPDYLEEYFAPPRSTEPAPQSKTSAPARDGLIPTDWWVAPASEALPNASPPNSEMPEKPKLELPERARSAIVPPPHSSKSPGPSPPPAPEVKPVAAQRPAPGGRAGVAATPPPPTDGEAGAFDDALRSLLAGAGLNPAHVTPELAETLGRVLRVSVEGLMDLLRARMEVKNQFRMPVTLIQASDNNPLKFSTSAEDALHNLLVKKNAGYRGPVDAFEASFEDLRFHQMALLAGMRKAFFVMLERFDPEALEALFERRQGGRLRRRSHWEHYRELFEDIRRDTEANFNRLFGEAFVSAYEQQMEELKAAARRR